MHTHPLAGYVWSLSIVFCFVICTMPVPCLVCRTYSRSAFVALRRGEAVPFGRGPTWDWRAPLVYVAREHGHSPTLALSPGLRLWTKSIINGVVPTCGLVRWYAYLSCVVANIIKGLYCFYNGSVRSRRRAYADTRATMVMLSPVPRRMVREYAPAYHRLCHVDCCLAWKVRGGRHG